MPVSFAKRIENMKASEIREILKITEKPEIISFAGGLPAPELFPIEEMKDVAARVLDEDGRHALQYSTTEGYTPLREKIAARMNNKFNTSVSCENILITSGSQQGLDFIGKLFLDEGDVILCERPTYLGAISAFKAYQPNFVEVASDNEGMLIDDLKKALDTYKNVKMIYIVSNFQNPTGITWSYERRMQFMEVVNKYEVPVIEDNPYGELRFEGTQIPSIKSMDKKGLVMYLGTFSKIFCPGLRIAWVAADNNIIQKLVTIKQAGDLQSSTISQREIDKYLEIYDIDKNIEKICAVYKSRRDTMIKTIQKEFPASIKYTYPEGGLFNWVELPEHINARQLLDECLKVNVAFVPGGSFYANSPKENTFRLNYSNMPEDRIAEGIKQMAVTLKKFI
jgi:2-aminoadipate transaminase